MAGRIEKEFVEKLTKSFNRIHGGEVITKKAELPEEFKETTFSYEPDVVIRVNGKITHIVEVETDPIRKALVGGACTCAYFVKKYLLGEKPKLYFAIGEKGSKYIDKFQARNKILDEFFRAIFSDIRIGRQQEIFELLKKDLELAVSQES